MLDVALLSSKPNFPFLLLNCTEAVPSLHGGRRITADGFCWIDAPTFPMGKFVGKNPSITLAAVAPFGVTSRRSGGRGVARRKAGRFLNIACRANVARTPFRAIETPRLCRSAQSKWSQSCRNQRSREKVAP